VRRDDAEGRSADEFAPYLEHKFIDCVEQVFDEKYANQLFLNINSFERCPDVAQVMTRLTRATPA